jgi:predicted HD superfamily hydrolase involved in NAD metabolism
MDKAAYMELLKERLSEKRFAHSIEVMKEAGRLARRFGADPEKAELAGLLHDITKECGPKEQLQLCEKFGITVSESERAIPKILHAVTGAAVLERELGITDPEILDAVRYHTTGRERMGLLEKIIYIADCVEPTRNYYGVQKIRAALKRDGLNAAILTALTGTISVHIERDSLLDLSSVKARNYFLLHRDE